MKSVIEKKKIYAGYINLKPINGIIFPSYSQNQINKDYITNQLFGEFFMSTNENKYGKNNIVLRSLIEKKDIKGICLLSIFALPENSNQRNKIYKMLIKNKKEFHFVFENRSLKSEKQIEGIEDYFIFNRKFFTVKKIKLSKFEKKILDTSWSFI